MRVDPSGTSQIVPTAVGSAQRAAARAAEAPAGTDPGSFAPSSDLAGLLAAVRRAPDVRAGAIESAAAKLAAGALDTPEAAADAAKGLLDSGDAAPAG